jgi:hypothetical protein
MTRTVGQTLRRLGLLIEAACALGAILARRGYVALWERSGIDPNIALAALFAAGVCLWIAGSLILLCQRPGA